MTQHRTSMTTLTEDGQGSGSVHSNEKAPSGLAAESEIAKAEEGPLPDLSNDVRDEESGKTEREGEGVTGGQPAKHDPGAGFPDGGRTAWLAVFGAFWCLFVSFGWINCIGIFQDVYQSDILRDLSPSTVAWIPSLETFFMFAVGPIWGRLYDNYGPRWILLGGTLVHVFGLMMASLSTKYYQFILTQGLVSPIGASAIFFSSVNSVSTWFFHRRALAVGIVAAGSSLGGVIFPIMVQNLIPLIGFPWTMRVCAFVILGLLVISNLTVKSRLPPSKAPFKFEMVYKCFTERTFLLFTLGAFFFFLAIFIPFNFVILQAEHIGVDPRLAQYLIPILNAVSILGRTLPGYMGDKLGRTNVLTVLCYLAGILVLALWLPSASEAAVIVFAALYGFTSGAFVSLIPACIAQISPIKEIGVRNGNLFAAISVAALIGNPIAGALIAQDNGSYKHLQIFCGVLLLTGSTFLAFARISIAGFRPAKV